MRCSTQGRPAVTIPDTFSAQSGIGATERLTRRSWSRRPFEAFTLVEGARNNRQPRDESVSTTVAAAWHAEIVRTATRLNRAGDRRQARRYLERELHDFERYCASLEAALPLLKEIATLKQNAERTWDERTWDERTRKEMEIAAYAAQTSRADYRSPRRSWINRLNDEK